MMGYHDHVYHTQWHLDTLTVYSHFNNIYKLRYCINLYQEQVM